MLLFYKQYMGRSAYYFIAEKWLATPIVVSWCIYILSDLGLCTAVIVYRESVVQKLGLNKESDKCAIIQYANVIDC